MTNNYTEQIASILSGKIEIQDVSDEVIQIILEEHPYSPYGHLIHYLKAKSKIREDASELLTKLATYSPDRAWLQQVLSTTFKDIEIIESDDQPIPSEAKDPNLDKVLFEFDFNYASEPKEMVNLSGKVESTAPPEAPQIVENDVLELVEAEQTTPKEQDISGSYVSWLKTFRSQEEDSISTESVESKISEERTSDKVPEIAEKTTRKDKDLFGGIITETLAELLANQGQTEKAISMYERLSLIFPNKSAFFAAKIEQLKSNIT